ncbi:MAG: hypothetical protein V1703_03220, partial [Candidatus Altiarchaeota archaeon]
LAHVLYSGGFRKSLFFVVGSSLPLILIAIVNYSLYGSITTGYSEMDSFFGGYGYFHLILLSVLFYALYVLYPRLSSVFPRSRVLGFYALLTLLLLVAFTVLDSSWPLKLKTSLQVVYAEVFDIGSFPSVEVYPGKKALLQSSPFLVLSFFAIIDFLWKRKGGFIPLFIAFSIAEVVFFSSVVGQHGEVTQNMRFFFESLPFLAAFSAYSMCSLIKDVRKYEMRAYAILFLLTSFIFILANRETVAFVFYRSFPLLMVFCLIALFVIRLRVTRMRVLYTSLIIVALAYSFFINLSELAVSVVSREFQMRLSSEICEVVAGDSVILYYRIVGIVPLAPVRLCGNPRFALIDLNKTEEAFSFVDFYLNRNVPIYIVDDGQYVEWSLFAEELRSKHNSNITIEPHVTVTRLYS